MTVMRELSPLEMHTVRRALRHYADLRVAAQRREKHTMSAEEIYALIRDLGGVSVVSFDEKAGT